MTQNQNNEIGANIYIKTFFLPDYIMNENDTICITIISLPDQRKQKYMMLEKSLFEPNFFLNLNISKHTKKLIIDFKKQNFMSDDHSIAFSIINQDDFPEISENNLINLNLFSTIYQQEKENKELQDNEIDSTEIYENLLYRKVIGNMKIQLSFSEPFDEVEQSEKNNKINNNFDFGKGFRLKTFERKSQCGSNEFCTYKTFGDYYLF